MSRLGGNYLKRNRHKDGMGITATAMIRAQAERIRYNTPYDYVKSRKKYKTGSRQ